MPVCKMSPIWIAAILGFAALFVQQPARAADVLAPHVRYSVSAPARLTAVGDFNGDGRKDVLVLTGYEAEGNPDNTSMLVYHQDAAGALQGPARYPIDPTLAWSVSGIRVADMNNDGLDDVMLNEPGVALHVFRQNLLGGFALAEIYPTYYSSVVASGDVTGDGRADLVGLQGVDSFMVGSFAAMFAQGAGSTLEAPVYYPATYSEQPDVAIGDVNGDGLNDVVVMPWNVFEEFGVLTQAADGTFNPIVWYPYAGSNDKAAGVAIGDFNGDRRNDVLLAYGTFAPNAYYLVFHQNAAGTLDAPVSYPAHSYPISMSVADFNGDGRDDVVAWNQLSSTNLSVSLQEVDGGLSLAQIIQTPLPLGSSIRQANNKVAVGDVNGDSTPDVVVDANEYVSLSGGNYGFAVLLSTTAGNRLPVPEAGPDQTVEGLSLVTLDGSASYDRDGQIVTYRWRQLGGTPVVLQDTDNPAIVQFATAKLRNGVKSERLVFALTVTDDKGATVSDRIDVSVVKKQ